MNGPSQAVPSSSSSRCFDAGDILDLHHRPLVDEQAGERDRLVEKSAAVASEVEHHGVDALGLEAVNQLPAIVGATHGIGVASSNALGVAVEGGETDHADLDGLAVGLGLDDLPLGVGLAQFDLLADQVIDLLFLGLAGLDDQLDVGVGLASDVTDDVSKPLFDEVDLGAVILLDAEDLVFRLDSPVLIGRTRRESVP